MSNQRTHKTRVRFAHRSLLEGCLQHAFVFQPGEQKQTRFSDDVAAFCFFLTYRNFVILLWDLLGVWDGYSYFERNTKRELSQEYGAGRFPKCCFWKRMLVCLVFRAETRDFDSFPGVGVHWLLFCIISLQQNNVVGPHVYAFNALARTFRMAPASCQCRRSWFVCV